MIVLARRQQLTDDELRQHAPSGSGRLSAYVVAHEGEAKPLVVDSASASFRGIRMGALGVRAVHSAIRRGLAVLMDHKIGTYGQDGSRRKIGEVVSSFVRDVGGKLACIVMCKMSEDVPAVSMEANMILDEDGNVRDVRSVDAIAGLKDDKPGFAGAIKLGEVYCFDATDETTEDKPVTMTEIKAAIKELNVVPSQVFDVEDFKRDHNPAISEPMREYAKLKKSAASDRAELNKMQSGPRLADALKAASLTDEQNTFVEKFAKRTPGLEGLDDDGLKGLIASGKELYADLHPTEETTTEETTEQGQNGDVSGETSKFLEAFV